MPLPPCSWATRPPSAPTPEEGLALLDQAPHAAAPLRAVDRPGLLAFTAAQAESLLGRIKQAVARDGCRRISESLGELWALSWLNWNLSIGWLAAGDLRQAETSAVAAGLAA